MPESACDPRCAAGDPARPFVPRDLQEAVGKKLAPAPADFGRAPSAVPAARTPSEACSMLTIAGVNSCHEPMLEFRRWNLIFVGISVLELHWLNFID